LASAPISGVIHLAGAHGKDLELGKDQSHWEEMINANLKNAYDLTTAVMENLDLSRLVHFVFTTSIAYRRGAYENIAYSISKAGIVGLTRSLAKRIGARGVVNAIAPGIIDTKMPGEYISRHKDRLLTQIPMHRFGEVDEVANLISFLMSDKCTYITGQVINIDGGSFNS
jgi:3-oxoacyl-[acyl-carrier protein] reductase